MSFAALETMTEMARRNRNSRRPDRSERTDGVLGSADASTEWNGLQWVVRTVSGAAATKEYRCPGCDQLIRPGTGHIVAWLAEGNADDRRHWHRTCWEHRAHRNPDVLRSRSAPRYGR